MKIFRPAFVWPVLAALLVVPATATSARGQEFQILEQSAPPRPAVLDQMLTLRGQRAALGYFPGSLDRADHMLRRLEWVSHWIDRWSEAPIPSVVYVIDRAHWAEFELPGTYGLPLRSAATAIFAPADGDAGTVAAWQQWLGSQLVPLVPGQPLVGTPEMAGTLVLADMLLQIELARAFAQNANLIGDQVWVGEAVSHSVAISLFEINEKARLAEIDAVFARLRAHLEPSARAPLSSFSAALLTGSGENVKQWLWFQGVFHEAGRLVSERYGRHVVKKLLTVSRKNHKRLSSRDLLEDSPALRSWLEQAFPEVAATMPPPAKR